MRVCVRVCVCVCVRVSVCVCVCLQTGGEYASGITAIDCKTVAAVVCAHRTMQGPAPRVQSLSLCA